MACLECVRACSTAFYKEFHQDKACLKIVERNGKVRPMTSSSAASVLRPVSTVRSPRIRRPACTWSIRSSALAAPPRSASPAASVSRPARWRSSRSARADFGYPVLSAYSESQKTAVPFSGHGSFSCFRPEIWLRIRDRYDMITKEHRNIDMEVMNHYGRNQKDPGTC